MKSIFKTLIVPHVDYCSQLWMPIKTTQIYTIDKLQKDFLNRIPSIRELNYWNQLKELKMLSLQRRLERYRILYVWKTLEGQVPNCGITVKECGRMGRMCSIPTLNLHAKVSVQSMKEQIFQVNGPRLFKALPANIRNMTMCSIDDFKMALDKYLELVPDEPAVRGLTPGGCTMDARATNSILDQARRVHMDTHPTRQRGGST